MGPRANPSSEHHVHQSLDIKNDCWLSAKWLRCERTQTCSATTDTSLHQIFFSMLVTGMQPTFHSIDIYYQDLVGKKCVHNQPNNQPNSTSMSCSGLKTLLWIWGWDYSIWWPKLLYLVTETSPSYPAFRLLLLIKGMLNERRQEEILLVAAKDIFLRVSWQSVVHHQSDE